MLASYKSNELFGTNDKAHVENDHLIASPGAEEG